MQKKKYIYMLYKLLKEGERVAWRQKIKSNKGAIVKDKGEMKRNSVSLNSKVGIIN